MRFRKTARRRNLNNAPSNSNELFFLGRKKTSRKRKNPKKSFGNTNIGFRCCSILGFEKGLIRAGMLNSALIPGQPEPAGYGLRASAMRGYRIRP
ncbi:MAG: hypothetical protein WA139_05490 [Candidatus Aenigmatarchaeota archaeon]